MRSVQDRRFSPAVSRWTDKQASLGYRLSESCSGVPGGSPATRQLRSFPRGFGKMLPQCLLSDRILSGLHLLWPHFFPKKFTLVSSHQPGREQVSLSNHRKYWLEDWMTETDKWDVAEMHPRGTGPQFCGGLGMWERAAGASHRSSKHGSQRSLPPVP